PGAWPETANLTCASWACGTYSVVLNLNQTGYLNQTVLLTLNILQCPTMNGTVQWRQAGYNGVFANATGDTCTAYYGADITFRWNMTIVTPLNTSAVPGQTLNGVNLPDGWPEFILNTAGWSIGTYSNNYLTLDTPGSNYAYHWVSITIIIIACPTANTTVQWKQTVYNGVFANATGDTCTAYYGADITFRWNMSVNLTLYTGTVPGQALNGVTAPAGWPEFTLASANWLNNTYLVELDLNCTGFNNRTAWIRVTILTCPTLNGTVQWEQPNYNNNFSNATGNVCMVSFGADITFRWNMSVNLTSYTGTVPGQALNGWTTPAGWPQVTFATAGWSVGIYFISLNLNQTGYLNHSVMLMINVAACLTLNSTVQWKQTNYSNTFAAVVGNNCSVYYGANVTFRWNMAVNTMLNTSVVAGQTLNGTGTPAGWPEVTLPSANWLTGSYAVVLNLNQTGYQNQSVTLNVRILACPVGVTIDMWQYNFENGSQEWGPYTGQNVSIGLMFSNLENNTPLTAVNTLVLIFSTTVNASANSWRNGVWFNSTLPTYNETYGTFWTYVNMSTINYAFANISFPLNIVMVRSMLAVSGAMTQNGTALAFSEDGAYWYSDDNKTNLVVDVVARNIINQNLLDGGALSIRLSDGTEVGSAQSLGNGTYEIIVSPTSLLKNQVVLLTITFSKANFQDSTVPVKVMVTEQPPAPAPAPTPAPPDNSWFIEVLVAVAIGAVLAGIYMGPVKKRKDQQRKATAQITSIFNDAANIQHFFVISIGSGLCLYSKNFRRETVDANLITGFLQALSTFGTEMNMGQALDEMKYGKDMIFLSDGVVVRAALLLTNTPSAVMRHNIKQFVSTFEEVYRDELAHWTGNVRIFDGAVNLIDEIFNISINLPHEIVQGTGTNEVASPMAKKVLQVAQQMISEDNPHLDLSSLLTVAAKSLRKTPGEVFTVIGQLRKAGVLRPIPTEEYPQRS
ncbi:MAG TPA: hypothetical protein VKK79_04655, partial [Candidatus Lokiarchaeia archaeon]|nr:hypothetical protein [Candidatus Lokiarchaeia archaeon]